MAHELAHHVHGDVWRAAAWRLLVLLAGFGAAAGWLPRLVSPGTASIDLAALPALGLIVQAIAALASAAAATPCPAVTSGAPTRSRWTLTRNPDAFARSMRRLAAHNLIDERPTALSAAAVHTSDRAPSACARSNGHEGTRRLLRRTTSSPRIWRARPSGAVRLQ